MQRGRRSYAAVSAGGQRVYWDRARKRRRRSWDLPAEGSLTGYRSADVLTGCVSGTPSQKPRNKQNSKVKAI